MGDGIRHYPRGSKTACRISLMRTPFSSQVVLANGTIDVNCFECKDAMGWLKKEPATNKNHALLHYSRSQVQRPKR